MDLVDGATALDDWARPKSIREVLMALLCVIDGLAALHSAAPPVIHHDIKPSNILVDKDGRVRIVDFGLASVSPEFWLRAAGTPGFIAPESLAYVRNETHKQPGPEADVYSLGRCIAVLVDDRHSPGRPLAHREDDFHALRVARRAMSWLATAATATNPAERPLLSDDEALLWAARGCPRGLVREVIDANLDRIRQAPLATTSHTLTQDNRALAEHLAQSIPSSLWIREVLGPEVEKAFRASSPGWEQVRLAVERLDGVPPASIILNEDEQCIEDDRQTAATAWQSLCRAASLISPRMYAALLWSLSPECLTDDANRLHQKLLAGSG